jgi:HPt (histidine-containing phosphotransfer) domain-containing protein
MDGYVAKPIRFRELQAAIAQVIEARESAENCEPSSMSTSAGCLDWCHALETVGGDRGLLREVLQSLAEEIPQRIQELETAINDRDLSTLRRAGHSLKGALRLFGDPPALALAAELEEFGAAERFNGAADILVSLRYALEPIEQELAVTLEGQSE